MLLNKPIKMLISNILNCFKSIIIIIILIIIVYYVEHFSVSSTKKKPLGTTYVAYHSTQK